MACQVKHGYFSQHPGSVVRLTYPMDAMHAPSMADPGPATDSRDAVDVGA